MGDFFPENSSFYLEGQEEYEEEKNGKTEELFGVPHNSRTKQNLLSSNTNDLGIFQRQNLESFK